MQFLYSALYSNEVKELYLVLPPGHTCIHQHRLNSSSEHTTQIHATRRQG